MALLGTTETAACPLSGHGSDRRDSRPEDPSLEPLLMGSVGLVALEAWLVVGDKQEKSRNLQG